MGTDYGLYSLDGNRFVKLNPEAGWYTIPSLYADEQGLWVGTAFGVHRLTERGLERVEPGPRTRVEAMTAGPDGVLHAIYYNGLAIANGSSFELLPSFSYRPGSVLVDREGGIWSGFYGDGGLYRLRRDTNRAVVTDETTMCLFGDDHERLWLGTLDGLTVLEDGARTDYDVGFVRSLSAAEGDSLWIATNRGLVRWVEGEIVPADLPPKLSDVEFEAVFQDSSGALWLARKGSRTYVVRDGDWREVEELSAGPTHWFHEDESGQVWMGHSTGLFRGSSSGIQEIESPLLGGESPELLYGLPLPDGDLWLATKHRLLRLRDGRFSAFDFRDGLVADRIDRLGVDGNGNLWMGGRLGFSFVPLQELEDFAAGRLASLQSHSLEQDLGLSHVVGFHAFPRSHLAADGTLYLVAGHEGVLVVPPQAPPPNGVPPLPRIELVRVDGQVVAADTGFDFSSGARRVSFEFAAPSFTAPDNVRVRYRLDGYDEAWIDAGTERLADYTNLAPGSYSFQLIAENEDGVTSGLEESLPFTVRPRLHERTGVQALAGVAAVLLAVAYYRLRTRGIRRRNEALEREIRERKRAEEEARRHWDQLGRVSRAASMGEITTSIAHEVKQPLFAIVSNAQTARRMLDREDPDREEVLEALEDIAGDGKRASEIIDHVRALVRKEHGPLEELHLNDVAREAIRLVAPEIRRRGLSLRAELQRDLPSVKGDPIELQQVVINLILNGAQAMENTDVGHLTVGTTATNGSVTLTVEDQGVGLDEEASKRLFEPFYTTKPQGTGMGLAMNRAIIERHGGKIRARSNEGPGATFEFSLQTHGDSL